MTKGQKAENPHRIGVFSSQTAVRCGLQSVQKSRVNHIFRQGWPPSGDDRIRLAEDVAVVLKEIQHGIDPIGPLKGAAELHSIPPGEGRLLK